MGAVFKREIKAYFTSPAAYIFLAVFYFITGFYYIAYCLGSGTTDMSYVFSGVFTIMMILLPLLTMRQFSEEKKQKTDQCLLTAPVSLWGVVTGKFLAALTIFVVGMCIYIPYVLVLLKLAGSVAWSAIIGNMAGLLLLGAAFISIGIFVSSLTEQQIVAAVLSIVINLVLYMIDLFASNVSVNAVKKVMVSIGFYSRYTEFTQGIFNVTSILFFVSVVFVFNFLTVRVLEKRRWG